MTQEASTGRSTTLVDNLTILRRRKWVIVFPVVLVPLMALIISVQQQPLYQASAEVYLNRADIAAAVAGVINPALQQDPVRFLRTQADVARDPKLAERVVGAAGVPGVSSGALLRNSSVTPRSDADVLDVTVNNTEARNAVLLTNAYANEFTKYRTELDTARINDALDNVKNRIASLGSRGVSIGSPAYATLLENQTQLETVGKLLADNTHVLRPAGVAQKIRPRTQRNVALGVVFGAILAIGLAFLSEALDKRVRSEREIEEALGLPLLARIPKPERKLSEANALVMLAEPRSIAAESVRKLRTNVEFFNLERSARTIMVTSSVQREGKSTTIANLGVALARAGRRVALVDLDLRRPYVHRFFGIPSGPGITDVVLGRLDLSKALRPVVIPEVDEGRSGRFDPRFSLRLPATPTNGHRRVEGALNVLPAGTIPPDAGELVGTQTLGKVLEALSEQFDYVLIDAPPLLAVGDPLTLSAKVDAMFVVIRLNVVHRGMLDELVRLLHACPAEKLGYVLAGAEYGEGYGYAYAYEPSQPERIEQQHVS